MVVVVFVGGLVGLVVHNAITLVDHSRVELAALASAHLERTLTVGPLSGTLYPRLAVVIEDLRLESRHKGRPPLLVIPRIEFAFRTDRALLTRGFELITEDLVVSGGEANVQRGSGGDVEFMEVIDRLPPILAKDLQGAIMEHVRIEHLDVEIVDEISQTVVHLADLRLETRNAALGRPFDARLQARPGDGDGATATQQLQVDVHVDSVPRDLVLWPFPVSTIDVAVNNVDVRDALAALALPPIFDSGTVNARLAMVADDDHHLRTTIVVDGEARSVAVTTGTGAGVEKHGVQRPLAVVGVVDVDVDSGAVAIETLSVMLAGMAFDASARIDAFGLRDLELLVDIEELARLGLLVPGMLTTAPGAFLVAGGAQGRFMLRDDAFSGDFNFDQATVHVGEAIGKSPGERLRLGVQGLLSMNTDTTPARGLVDSALAFQLRRGTRFNGSLMVPPAEDGADNDVLLALHSNHLTLAEASHLSSILNDVFGVDQVGRIAANLTARISGQRTAVDLDLRLDELALVYDGTTAAGEANVHVDVDADQDGLALGGRADGTWLTMQSVDDSGAVLMTKDRGDAIVATANVREVGGRGSLGLAIAGMASTGAVVVGDGLTPKWQRIINGLQGRAGLSTRRLTLARAPFTDVDLRLRLRQGRLHVEHGVLSVFGGVVTMDETVSHVTLSPSSWGLQVKARALSAAELLAPLRRFTGEARGTVDVDATLSATGLSIGQLLRTLDGPVTVSTHDVHIANLDLVSSWFDRVWSFIAMLPGVDAKEIAAAKGLGGAIADGRFTLHFTRDRFLINEPVVVVTTLGLLRLEGAAGFDGAIALSATLALEHPTLRQWQVLTDEHPLLLRVAITGTWGAPVFEADNLDVLRAALLARATAVVQEALTSVQEGAQTFQDRVNAEVERAKRSVEQTLGTAAAGSSRGSVTPTPSPPVKQPDPPKIP